MDAAGSLERAALPIALFACWCARHDLLAPQLASEAADRLLRLRYEDLSPCEFFVPVFHGELTSEGLSAQGAQFAQQVYAEYQDFFLALEQAPYELPDSWNTYARVAPWLSARFAGGSKRKGQRNRGSKEKRWWNFWR